MTGSIDMKQTSKNTLHAEYWWLRATSLYEEPEDGNVAIYIVKQIIAAGRKVTQSDEGTGGGNRIVGTERREGADKTAYNIAVRFKDASWKFSGNLRGCWQEFVDKYKQVSRGYRLSNEQKLRYLHSLLRSDAKRYYSNHVDNYGTRFQQAVYMIEARFHPIFRQSFVWRTTWNRFALLVSSKRMSQKMLPLRKFIR